MLFEVPTKTVAMGVLEKIKTNIHQAEIIYMPVYEKFKSNPT